MSKRTADPRVETGVPNLDALLTGGIPRGSATIVGGTPGAGKTTLVQQICFHNASPKCPVLYFNTLSEPTAKTLRYMSQFAFFDREKVGETFHFADLGVLLRTDGLAQVGDLVMEKIKAIRPGIVVIDSFKVFDDLTRSRDELRRFGYELAVNLMAWNATAFLLGEYGPEDFHGTPLFSIVDGVLLVTQRKESGEQQRFLRVVKMRGTDHQRDEHAFAITPKGIEIFAPRVTIRREDRGSKAARCKTGISRFDDLLGDGIPRGSSLLVAGVAGTGKTVLLLEFIYRGAQAGEKGILFSFEETEERLLASARGLGWDLEREIARGRVEIVFIPQPDIIVEADLMMIRERIARLGARRVGVDSLSVFLHKVGDPERARERIFQLASLVQNAGAVGLLATDIAYGTDRISRFGVEETVVDGVVVLTSTSEGLERQRYIEVYKLRNTAHLKGRHDMVIGEGGITVFPRYDAVEPTGLPAPVARHRIPTGIPGLDPLVGGGLLERSVTFVTGSAGIGKTTLALQFVLEGVRRGESSLYVALEEDAVQLGANASSLGLPLEEAVGAGLLEVVHARRVRPNQLLAILSDKIRAARVQRLVIDGASHLVRESPGEKELRNVLNSLVARFKGFGLTSILTFESATLEAQAAVSERGVSPAADNLIVLRYRERAEALVPTLTVVKTRGSAHDFSTHALTFARGGIRVGEVKKPSPARPARKLRPKRRRR